MKKILLLAVLTLASAFAEPQQIIQIIPAPLPELQPTILIDNRPAPNVIVVTPVVTPAPMVLKPMEPCPAFANPQPICGKFKF
jgi:hypothetical protein